MKPKVDPVEYAWAKTQKTELPAKIDVAANSRAGLANAISGKNRKGKMIRVMP